MECGCTLEESCEEHKQAVITEEDRWDNFADALNTVNVEIKKEK